ncbi:MAG: serine/threonine protein kinase [Ilumatobacter sp.]|nr:serine/threonine protein kinase [Ilumatobacter sp.]
MNRIGDYELLENLGDGNSGTFFRARPPARLALDAEYVTLKVMTGHATDKEFRQVANELRVFGAVKCDQLVTVYDAGQQNGRLFYAMGWYPEGSLARDGVDRATAVAAVVDAAHGAHELHEVGVVHRDIKPSNIMLDNGRGRLGDLGLAQMLTPGMTTTGIGPIGSIEYMEPDVIWGERAARASDVWSLGMTLHRVVSGEGAFGVIPEHNVLDAFRHVLHRRPAISEQLPEEFRPIVERAVAAERSDRYSTAAEFAADLDRVARQS